MHVFLNLSLFEHKIPYIYFCPDKVKMRKTIKDNRESLIVESGFTDKELMLERNSLTPVYLIFYESL